MDAKKVLVLGATGMLGHVLLGRLGGSGLDVRGAVREAGPAAAHFAPEIRTRLLTGVDAESPDTLLHALAEADAQVVINCIGLVKQLPAASDPLLMIGVNALFPHRLARMCRLSGARLIHISTDCVYSGARGGLTEQDPPDAVDLYGRTKLLGELHEPHCVTLRTSFVGHELHGGHGLLEWFLAQPGKVRGHTQQIFSGLTTVELARVLAEHVIPDTGLSGLYHVSSDPISKAELLRLVAERYGKRVEIEPDASMRVDRSLDSSRFREATGYTPPAWPEQVETMHADWLRWRRGPYRPAGEH